MSKRRYHRRSKMKRRGVKNGSQNGSNNSSKMAPKWLPGGLWAALGPDPAARRSPEASRRGSGTARGVPKNSSWRPWNALGAKSGSISASWRVPGRSRRGSGRSFGELFGGWAGGNEQKADKSQKSLFFWSCFCMRFLTAPVCVLFASALAGAKAQLKNMLKTIGFYDIICVCAVCARSANILQTERKSNKKLPNNKRKNTMPRKLKKAPKKHRFGSQNASTNRPRSPPGAPAGPKFATDPSGAQILHATTCLSFCVMCRNGIAAPAPTAADRGPKNEDAPDRLMCVTP